MVYFNHVVLILKMYKYPRIFLLLRIFLKVVTEGHSILHIFDEDIVASGIFSLRFVLCSVWLCLRVHRLYTSKFLCRYPVLLLASVSGFLLLYTPFCIACTFISNIYRLFILLLKYFVRQESVYSRPE